jgi:hypothetical protein
MTDAERQLLQKLADAGKATTLTGDELLLAELLEAQGLVLIVRNSSDAIITPRGRHKLDDTAIKPKRTKKPLGFLG